MGILVLQGNGELRTAITFDDVNPSFIPYTELKRIVSFLETEKIRATFFAIPHGLIDGPKGYTELIRRVQEAGNEVALHGYDHAKNEFGYIFPIPLPSYEKQKELLAKGRDELTRLLSQEPLGFRAPNYRHSKITVRALGDLGFKYDSSKTVFKPTHRLHLRVKTGTSPKIMKLGEILEIPVTADYTLSTAAIGLEERLRIARKDFEWAKQIGGIFVVNNHVDIAKEFVFEFLHSLINQISHETEFVRLKDLIP